MANARTHRNTKILELLINLTLKLAKSLHIHYTGVSGGGGGGGVVFCFVSGTQR